MQFVTWKQQEQVRPTDTGIKGGERCRSVTHSVTHFDELRHLSPIIKGRNPSKMSRKQKKEKPWNRMIPGFLMFFSVEKVGF